MHVHINVDKLYSYPQDNYTYVMQDNVYQLAKTESVDTLCHMVHKDDMKIVKSTDIAKNLLKYFLSQL